MSIQLLSSWLILNTFFCSQIRLHPSQVTTMFAFASFAFASSAAKVGYEAAKDQDSQTSALLLWKASLDNQSQASLSSWTTDTNLCMWKAIVCDDSKSVSTINVTGFGLRGTLHGLNFSSFTKLFSLDIGNNSFNGTIPHQIGNLSTISQLKMDSNLLSGSVPTSIVKLANLSLLNLTCNQLSGYIPQEIGELGNLKYLLLGSNKLSGSIPPSVGMLTNLVQLDLSNNSLSGTIPSIRNLRNLETFWLFNNSLSGHFPEELGSLHALTSIMLSNNILYGKIPLSIGNLVNLTRLEFENNKISGSIPSTLWKLNQSHLDGHGPKHAFWINSYLPRKLGQSIRARPCNEQSFRTYPFYHWKFDKAPILTTV